MTNYAPIKLGLAAVVYHDADLGKAKVGYSRTAWPFLDIVKDGFRILYFAFPNHAPDSEVSPVIIYHNDPSFLGVGKSVENCFRTRNIDFLEEKIARNHPEWHFDGLVSHRFLKYGVASMNGHTFIFVDNLWAIETRLNGSGKVDAA